MLEPEFHDNSNDSNGGQEVPYLHLSTFPELLKQGSEPEHSNRSNMSIRQKVKKDLRESSRIELDQAQLRDEKYFEAESTLTVQQAFKDNIMVECKESPLGICLMREMSRFIEVLDLYKPIADFSIQEIFKLSRFEDGLPKSIILQKEKLEQIRLKQEQEKNRTSSMNSQ